MIMATKEFASIEKTFLMVKPDGVKRGLVGEIFHRMERIGLKLVACRMITATKEQARDNYPGTKEWLVKMGEKTFTNYHNDSEAVMQDLGTTDLHEIGKKIHASLISYLTEGPVVISVWEGNHAVDVVCKLLGKTDPVLADVGSVRGDFGFDTPQLAVKSGRVVFKTLVHRSDSVDEAKREIKHWFGENYKDLGNYQRQDYADIFTSY
jgi:nucleoside-diphosphate kinase